MSKNFKIQHPDRGWWRQDSYGYTDENEAGWWSAADPVLATVGPDDALVPFEPTALQLRLRRLERERAAKTQAR